MSFFFTKAKKATTPQTNGAKKSYGVSHVLRNQSAMLHRAGCKGCPLNNTTKQPSKVAPALAQNTLVYFLAATPDTGPAHQLVRSCIPDDEEQFVSFDSVINCHSDNDKPSWHAVECCRPRRWQYIEQAKPKVIVGLGPSALHAMLGTADIIGMRGRLFAVKVGQHKCWFLPTEDPEIVLKKAYDKKKPLQSRLGHCFRADIERAFKEAGRRKPPVIDTDVRSGIQTFDGGPGQLVPLLNLLKQARIAPIKAVDLETRFLRPFAAGAALMTAAVSFEAINFAFAIDHPRAGWGRDERTQIMSAFEALLRDRDTIKVAHNLPFELEWLIHHFGKDVADHYSFECSQMQAFTLDERRAGQSLEDLIHQHFGIKGYKGHFKLNKEDMAKSDLGETLIYNACDTKFTLRLWHTQDVLLKEQGLEKAYFDALPRQTSVALMQTLGIGVDQTTVKEYQKKLGAEVSKLFDAVTQHDVVKQFIKKEGRFDPLSQPQALKLFKDYLHRPEVIKRDKSGNRRYAVSKDVLEQIDHPLARQIVTLRNRNKMKSTYVDGIATGGKYLFPDGLIHCNFNCTFTETGRTSADFPSMQNFPQRNDAWIRKQVIAGEGQVLLAFDYTQLEACTAAMCSRDPALVKALCEDYDIHAEWSHKLYDLYPQILSRSQSIEDPKAFKKLRSVVKNKLVFPAIFGAQNESIAGYLDVPVEIIDKLMKQFWNNFAGLHRWQTGLMKRYYQEGIVSSYTGRLRRYPLSRHQVINHPVQCLGAEIVCNSMNRLSELALTTGQWHLHPRLNIHDDITVAIPDKDAVIEDSIKQISDILLTPPYSCINVPLAVKASIGTNWLEMDEIGQFWSNRI